jgi:hypothetical protein
MANTLNVGNGNWAVKKGSLLGYNSENNNFKPLPFSFERASSATVVNKAGLIETVGSGEPRIDYKDDVNGALLLEPQRTNLVTYSEDFSNNFWLIQNLSASLNSIISPDGTLNATKLIEDSSNSTHRILNGNAITFSGDVSISVFAKKGERNWIRLTNNNVQGAFFDLENGVIANVISGINAKIENYGNGWYRCSISQTGLTSERLAVFTSIDGVNTTYQGDGTSGVYIYGAQLEQGSYATSYIPTQGSAVTRIADACNNGGNEQVINSTEGVLYAEVAFIADDNTISASEITISDETLNNNIRFLYSPTTSFNSLFVRFDVAGVRVATFNYVGMIVTDFNKVAIKWKENDFALWINGIEVLTDLSGATFSSSTLSTINFSNAVGGENFYGNVKDVRVYNTALTDSELATLTTI